MSPVRRNAAAVAPPPPQEELFDMFNLGAYAGGKTIPEGDYAVEFIIQEHQAVNAAGQQVGKPRLITMLVAYPRAGGDPIEQPLGWGGKALASWVPNSTGKGVIKRAGGPGLPPTNKSNWLLFLDSMVQCGLPNDALRGQDLSAIDGVWMHIKPVPEPEERKSFKKQAATGEAADQADDEPRGNGLMPICTEILPGGEPWAGGGGFDPAAGAPTAPAKPVAAVNRRAPAAVAAAPAPAAPARRAPAAAPVAAPAEVDTESLESVAMECIGDVLVQPAFANGLKRMKLRMETHSAAVKKFDEQTASDIISTYFSSDASLGNLLGTIGYKLSGVGPQQDVLPAA